MIVKIKHLGSSVSYKHPWIESKKISIHLMHEWTAL